MTDNLVELLREAAMSWRTPDRLVCDRAADRIEKLEAALREIADEENWGSDGCWAVESYPDEIASEALEN